MGTIAANFVISLVGLVESSAATTPASGAGHSIVESGVQPHLRSGNLTRITV